MNLSWSVRPLLAALVLGAAGLGVLQWAALGDPSVPFSAYGQGEDQLSQLRESLGGAGYGWASLVTGPLQLGRVEDPTRTVYMAAGVEISYSQTELDAIERFTARGGHLFVADTGPGSNPLLARFGLAVANRTIQDPTTGSHDWIAARTEIRGARETLFLGAASAIVPSWNLTIETLVESTESSFLDLDEDGRSTSADLMGPFPTLVLVRDAGGTTHLFASDLSLLADRSPSDGVPRQELWTALLRRVLPDGGQVLFDEARHTLDAREQRAYRAWAVVASTVEGAPYLLAVSLVGLGGALWSVRRRSGSPWGPHRGEARWLDIGGPEPDREGLRSKLVLLVLARLTNLTPEELAKFRPDRLAAMAPHHVALHAALAGNATEAQWRYLESEMEN